MKCSEHAWLQFNRNGNTRKHESAAEIYNIRMNFQTENKMHKLEPSWFAR